MRETIELIDYTDEERQRIEDLINQIEEERKTQKWWVMPNFDCFEQYNPSIGLNYFVEPQKDSYSRNRPPLKSDFESKEAAEKWLNDYLKEDDLFKKAADEIKYLECRLNGLLAKLRNHQYISMADIHDCFESFNASLNHGSIKEVI